MNGINGDTAVEDIDELAAEWDDESDDDSESAAEFWPGFPLPPVLGFGGGKGSSRGSQGRRGYYQPPATGAFASQAQLQGLSRRVQSDIRAVSARVTAVERTATRLGAEVAKQHKTNAVQSRQITAVRNEMKKARDMSLIMYLLTKPKTLPATTAAGSIQGANVPAGTHLLYETGGGSSMLPLMLMMGGLGGDGGSDSNSLLLVLALSGGL